ncbi:hypothetical protein [Nocardioides lijunqiniae]|uniref:hypothetical protein n=1 Tax=Nocardioides lijunqiniae TaxID=2760832 RepID=UPI0018782924|nr:hypothetical protein [Nocardioides lijunqiniae]
MSRSDTLRRAVSLTLAVLCLMVVPQVAFARFTATKAPAVQVGVAKLVTPTAVTGSYSCRTGFFTEGLDVNVTGFSDNGQPSGVSYTSTLYRGTTQRATRTSTSEAVSLSTGLQLIDSGNTSYRVTIVTRLGGWTAPEYSRTISCGFNLPSSGSL